jgi:hypothetical protein
MPHPSVSTLPVKDGFRLRGAEMTRIGLLLPASWAGVPGWAYMVLPVAMPLHGRASARRHARLLVSESRGSGERDVRPPHEGRHEAGTGPLRP